MLSFISTSLSSSSPSISPSLPLSLLQDFPSVVVMYTLKAMQCGCQEATRLVPRLLQLVDLYPETLENFKKKVNNNNQQQTTIMTQKLMCTCINFEAQFPT